MSLGLQKGVLVRIHVKAVANIVITKMGMEMGRERAGRALGPMRVREGRSRGEKEEEGKR